MISPARMLAFQQLKKILQDGSYSNLTVAESLRGRSVTEADRALSTTLVYGVIERKITLDYQLTRYLKQPLRKLKPAVYLSLLLGSYQILFLSKIPDHAAVNESVELVKKNGAAYAGGLVNAVLHKIIQNGLVLPEEGNDVFRTSIEYSCPEYLIELWQNAYGEEATLGILKASLGAKPVTVRVNTTKTTTDNLIRTLQEEGVRAERNELVEDALDLSHVGSVEQLPSFQNGLFHVQDASSQLCCKQLDVQPGDVVYDMCAAPGGKTFTLAERMGDNGFIQAFDLHEHRVRLIQDGAERLGLRSVTAAVGNAEEFEEGRPLADRILCDVPCAGLGIIGRKPEIRYKDPGSFDNLPPLQYHILCIASRYLKPRGRLIYSTCSLNPAENEAVVERFLSEHPDYVRILEKTLLPGEIPCDGFFYAVLERTEGTAWEKKT